MTFEQFAMGHGLIIKSLIFDKWVRVPTEDHPKKLNGAYIFDGQRGAIINFAMHDSHIAYKSDEPYKPDPNAAAKRKQFEDNRLKRQQQAKGKAAFILGNSTQQPHAYLKSKGFDEKGWVWNGLLVVPMRINSGLVGCQLIQEDGSKKFLAGQVTKGASLVIDNKGRDILCEGFATGLSVRRALKHLRVRYRIHICFSAGNMLEIAKTVKDPLVIADNDTMGVNTAKKIASRYWLGEADEDFNDTEQRLGTASVADTLRPFLEVERVAS
jgi:putative DNA primase/helicase